ncbi:MAG: hypothetical protein M5R38_06330 [Candidatus Methylomirabilis sp.]|nr:hypothetical protein [Candidatus Methylomirabilis sp.]
MTAQIAIMNKSAIALATDSAVTLGAAKAGGAAKVYQTVEKLFSLPKDHSVGIMISGNAEFMGVPWETIIKVYRGNLGQQSFARLEDYATHFIRFLEDQNPLFTEAQEEAHVRRAAQTIFVEHIRTEVDGLMESASESGIKLNKRMISDIVDRAILPNYQRWKAAPPLQGVPPDHGQSVAERHAAIFDEAIEDIFEDLPLSRVSRERLQKITSYMFSKESFHPDLTSGVVVAGFGEIEPFPSLLEFQVEATVNKRLKYAQNARLQISFETDGCIRPFAQDEMVALFMNGVDPDYQKELEIRHKELLANYRRRLLATVKPLRGHGTPDLGEAVGAYRQ